jgi:hypothetical protein
MTRFAPELTTLLPIARRFLQFSELLRDVRILQLKSTSIAMILCPSKHMQYWLRIEATRARRAIRD